MRYAIQCLIFFLFIGDLTAGPGKRMQQADPGEKELDIVFCLDLSGSTNGLIEDFRENLWYISNQLLAMEPSPVLRIGVVGFSRPSFGKNNAYIKILSDITDDLDAVAASVYRLRSTVEKGDQYVVPALETCVRDLNWSPSSNAVKMIFLVGNGMAVINARSYEKVCMEASKNRIIIESLYVLSNGNMIKELPAWRRIAALAGGRQTELTIHKADHTNIWNEKTPQSISINKKLHQTIRWNVADDVCRQNSQTADSGAFTSSANEWMNRMAFKSSVYYNNWLKNCGALAELGGKPAENLGEDVFSRQVNQTLQECRNLMEELNRETSPARIKDHHRLYKEGLKEESVLRRIVIIMAMEQWGERVIESAP
jgi:hypothetical protein